MRVPARSTPWRQKPPASMSRIEAVVGELVRCLPYTSDWRIQKACFVAEVQSIEERLERLSDADFAAWDYGPWSLNIREALESLCHRNALRLKVAASARRPQAEYYELASQHQMPALDPESRDFLRQLARSVALLKGEDLTALAKSTAPFLETSPRKLIDLDGYLAEIRSRHQRLQRSKKVSRLVSEALGSD